MKSKFPKIIIIVNCHNGEKYLKENILSIKKQTYKNWELIFYDNCSSDNSLKIVNKFKDKRIRVFKSNSFLSLYEARNRAISKSKGLYVAFLDTDDTWKPEKLSIQIKYILKKKLKICFTNYFIKKMKGKLILRARENITQVDTQNLLNNYNLGILTALIHKSIFLKKKFNKKLNIIGDFDFFIELSMSHDIGFINKPLATYRVHSNSLLTTNRKIYIQELKNWIYMKEKKFRKLNLDLKMQKQILLKLKIKNILKI